MEERIVIYRMGPLTLQGAEYVAVDGKGNKLASHYCTDDQWAKNDLGFYGAKNSSPESMGAQRTKLYADTFPEGFVVVWGGEK